MFGKASVNYEPKNEVVLATAQTPVLTASAPVILDFHYSTGAPATAAYEQFKKLQGNSQASLRFNIANWGSLTALTFTFYWYTNLGGTDTAFQRTTSTVAAAAE